MAGCVPHTTPRCGEFRHPGAAPGFANAAPRGQGVVLQKIGGRSAAISRIYHTDFRLHFQYVE